MRRTCRRRKWCRPMLLVKVGRPICVVFVVFWIELGVLGYEETVLGWAAGRRLSGVVHVARVRVERRELGEGLRTNLIINVVSQAEHIEPGVQLEGFLSIVLLQLLLCQLRRVQHVHSKFMLTSHWVEIVTIGFSSFASWACKLTSYLLRMTDDVSEGVVLSTTSSNRHCMPTHKNFRDGDWVRRLGGDCLVLPVARILDIFKVFGVM